MLAAVTLATLTEANRLYGRQLAAAGAVVAVLVWLANRPVRPRPLVGPPRDPWLPLAWARLRARRQRPGPLAWDPTPGWFSRKAAPYVSRGAPVAGMMTAGSSRLAMPAPARPHSELYDAYIKRGEPSPFTGETWRARRARLVELHLRLFGLACQGGWLCLGREPGSQLDHCAQMDGHAHDYVMLGRETVTDTGWLCARDHVYRTRLQRQGINAWRLPGTRRRW